MRECNASFVSQKSREKILKDTLEKHCFHLPADSTSQSQASITAEITKPCWNICSVRGHLLIHSDGLGLVEDLHRLLTRCCIWDLLSGSVNNRNSGCFISTFFDRSQTTGSCFFLVTLNFSSSCHALLIHNGLDVHLGYKTTGFR